jgi:hypothetical protein
VIRTLGAHAKIQNITNDNKVLKCIILKLTIKEQ